MLGVTRAFVYQHARTLGAIRIGSGETGRLRFDPEVALAAREARSPAQPNSDTRGGTRRRHASKRARPVKRHPFLEPTATWDAAAGLWRDGTGYPTHDQCWRSRGLGTQGLVAQGPEDEPGATALRLGSGAARVAQAAPQAQLTDAARSPWKSWAYPTI
jgi:hypothetical protein